MSKLENNMNMKFCFTEVSIWGLKRPTQPYGKISCPPFRKRSFVSAVVSACFDKIISFLCLEYSICGVRVYKYKKIYIISQCLLNKTFSLLIIYIYIRKTVMLNHVYQNHNYEILAFNIPSVDPGFFNIPTSSPLL